MTPALPARSDIPHLRPQLLVALLATLAGLALLAVAAHFHGKASAKLLAAEMEDASLRQRIDHFAKEEAELRDELRQYEAWGQRGILGDEQRAKWATALLEIRRRRHLVALHYEFAPQQALDLPLPMPIGTPFQFVSSPVQLTATAVHDGDLIGLLDDLGTEVPAFVRPRRCVVEHKHSDASGPGHLLLLDCQMDWITVSRAP